MECGCTIYLQGASSLDKDSVFCKKTETIEKVICVPPLFSTTKKIKKLNSKELLAAAYCGRSDFEVCDNGFTPPSPPAVPAPSPVSPVVASAPPSLPPFAALLPGTPTGQCRNTKSASKCATKSARGLCGQERVHKKCALTCGMTCHPNGDPILQNDAARQVTG